MILYMIGGLPGSGKSTIARVLANELRPDGEWAEADDFHYENGKYEWRAENIAAAHKACQTIIETMMIACDPNVIVANTFTRRWEREPYLALARKYGYRVVWLAVKTDLSDAELAARNIHGVTADIIAKMRARWED